jgi:hypothetical protein
VRYFRSVLLLVGLFTLSIGSCFAGPFGFERGMSKDDVMKAVGKGALMEVRGDVYVLSRAPNPHPDFNRYALVISPELGVVKIAAFSESIFTNNYGERLRAKFDDLRIALDKKYGTSEVLDYSREGAVWGDNPRDMMMGLLTGDRLYEAYWTMRVPDKTRLVGVSLSGSANSNNAGSLSITYEYVGFADYLRSKKTRAADTL